jgi:hypothetical protein
MREEKEKKMNVEETRLYKAAILRMLDSNRENQVRTIVIEGARSGHPVYVMGLMKSGREIPIARVERSENQKWIWSGLEDSPFAGRGSSGFRTLRAAHEDIEYLAFQDAGWITLGKTYWVKPGTGASIVELWDAGEAFLVKTGRASELTRSAFSRLSRMIKAFGQDYRTNLAVTGEPLTSYDVERISKCE